MTVQMIPFSAAQSEFTESAPGLSVKSGPSPPRRRLRSASAPLKRNTTMPATTAGATSWAIISCAIVTMGEPQGTAGQPMLNLFQREGVGNVCCVVTRYFGGILLGAGGLTRAYGKAARDALSAAGVSAMGLWEQVQLECDYGLLERVKLEIAAVDGILDDVVYAARVTVTASLPGDGPPAAAAAAHRAFRRLRHLAVPGPGPSPGSERRNIGAVSTRPGLR